MKPSRMLKEAASVVLASFRPSTYHKEYASALYSLRPRWTSPLNILRPKFASSQTSLLDIPSGY